MPGWLGAAVAVVLLLSACSLQPRGALGMSLEDYQQRFEREWRDQLHRLTNLQMDTARFGDLLGPVFGHKYTLPMMQVQKSLVYTGSNFRLRRVIHDALVGKRDIRIGVIGGSISHGARASKIGETDWFALVRKYMTAAFPRAKIIGRNGALPATPSAFMNMCLELSVDKQVDLLFVEYVCNDGANRNDGTKPKVYERLLRRIMAMEHNPAVVLVQLMPRGAAFSPGVPFKLPYIATLEDTYGVLSQYYDLPWLSQRNALWRLGEHHAYGYNWTDFVSTADYLHPHDVGHRSISDLVVNLIQQTAMGLVISPLSHVDKELMAEDLPVPLHPGNYAAKNRLCIYGEAFKPVAVPSEGWDFLDEGKGKPKWGYISHTPGARLTLELNTTRAAPGSGAHADRMSVMIAYLKSYTHMGRALGECLENCQCDKQELDGHHDSQTSTVFLLRLLPTQHPNCKIGITVLQETNSDDHKVKISGIMMNEYTGDDVGSKLHEEQWLGALQNINKNKGGKL